MRAVRALVPALRANDRTGPARVPMNERTGSLTGRRVPADDRTGPCPCAFRCHCPEDGYPPRVFPGTKVGARAPNGTPGHGDQHTTYNQHHPILFYKVAMLLYASIVPEGRSQGNLDGFLNGYFLSLAHFS